MLNSIYNVISGIIKAGCTLIATPFLIRFLGLENYGIWVIISSVLSIATLLEAGLTFATTVFLAKDLSKNDLHSFSKSLTAVFSLMLGVAFLFCLAFNYLSNSWGSLFPKLGQSQQEVLSSSLELVTVAVVVQLFQQIFLGIEQAYQRYKWMNILEALQLIFTAVGGVIIAWLSGKILMLAQWQVLMSVIFFFAHLCLVRFLTRLDFLGFQFNAGRIVEVLRYSFFNWISVLSMVLFSRGDRLIVGSLLGPSSLAVYASIQETSAVITSFTTRSVSPILPLISGQVSPKCTDQKILAKVEQFSKINVYVAISIGLVICLFSPIILGIMIPGEVKYVNLLALQLASLITALYSVSGIGYFILLGLNSAPLISLVFTISAIFTLSLITILSGKFGLIGAIVGNAGWISTLSITFFAVKKLRFHTSKLMTWFCLPLSVFVVIDCLVIFLLQRMPPFT